MRLADLAKVTHDRLLAELRKKLRKEFHLPVDTANLGVMCVYLAEPPVFQQADGSVCENQAEAVDAARG